MIIYDINEVNIPEGKPILKDYATNQLLVFDSVVEWQLYLDSITDVLQIYKSEVTRLMTIKIDNLCNLLDYDNIQDVAASNVVGGNWEEEAKSILLWVDSLWVERNAHFDTISENDNLDAQSFVDSLPNYL